MEDNHRDRPAEKARERFDKIIEVKNVTKVFDDVTVIDNLNLSVRRGQFVTLLGQRLRQDDAAPHDRGFHDAH